ncbi:MAG: hypothetical protein ABIH26_11205, partial [Candidatus Eisenbacteria bacterium]
GHVRKVYEKLKLPFPVLVDEADDIGKKYAVDTVPTVFVAGADGKVILRSLWNPLAVNQEAKILAGLLKPEDRQKLTPLGTG